MRRSIQILFNLVFLTLLCSKLFAQEKIQVVTKTIDKTFNCKEGNTLDIQGEKASIKVTSSADNKIHLKLMLISKNPSRQTAENDLKYCDYQFKETTNTITVSNFFNSKNDFKEIGSNLSAKYEIEVPANLLIKVKNIYGSTSLSQLNGNIKITSDFGQVELIDLSGYLSITSNYSDIKATNLNSQTNIIAKKADISLAKIFKTVSVKNQYGKIILDEIKAPVTVDADMTEINVNCISIKNYNFDLSSINGEINVPEDLRKMVIINGNDAYLKSSGNYLIKIKTRFNSISLKLK